MLKYVRSSSFYLNIQFLTNFGIQNSVSFLQCCNTNFINQINLNICHVTTIINWKFSMSIHFCETNTDFIPFLNWISVHNNKNCLTAHIYAMDETKKLINFFSNIHSLSCGVLHKNLQENKCFILVIFKSKSYILSEQIFWKKYISISNSYSAITKYHKKDYIRY